MSETLVVELCTEELPPKALKRLGEAFAAGIESGLRERGFLDPESVATSYATPRRLAVSVTCVRPVAPDAEVIDKLMPVRAARDASGITEAFSKKMKGLGRLHLATASLDATDGPDRVYIASDGKADYVYLRSLAKGQVLVRGLDESLADAIEQLPIPKLMSYQRPNGSTVKFARPAHRLLPLPGTNIVPVSALDLDAGRITDGHRFQSRGELPIATAEAWEPTLAAEGKVIASFGERRARIVAELEVAAAGAEVIMPDDLVDEVTALVEWPKVYTGGFDLAFLEVPQECLILTMQRNQKYFALEDKDGRLQNRFLLVSNLDAHDPEPIIRGNERVLRARLADAKFFYDQDRRYRLESRVPKLNSVVYYNKLGSQLDRVERVRAIGRFVADCTDANASWVDRAAYLAKADLLTEMVGEFPELQGLMGRYYALHDGEPGAIADAIGTQYLVRQDAREWAENLTGAVLMTADRTETLAGIDGIGLQPTGEKDPYGLRRAALGVISAFEALGAMARLKGTPLRLQLHSLLASAASTFPANKLSASVVPDLEDFVFERYRNQLAVTFEREVVNSVVDMRPPLNE